MAQRNSALAQLGRTDAIALAERMKSKLKNTKAESAKVTNRVVSMFVSGATGFGLGALVMGPRVAERNNMIDNNVDLDAEGDPTEIIGVPIDLGLGAVLSIASVAGFLGDPDKSGPSSIANEAAKSALACGLYRLGLERGAASFDAEEA